jgi:site-specific recombinase XerC
VSITISGKDARTMAEGRRSRARQCGAKRDVQCRRGETFCQPDLRKAGLAAKTIQAVRDLEAEDVRPKQRCTNSTDAGPMRRTKASQIYDKTGTVRAVQLLLGHTHLKSTVRHLAIGMDDALSISERFEL